VALLGAAALSAPTASAVNLVYDLPEDIVAIASDSPTLDSVLIDKREGSPLDANEAPDLEPISDVSEHEPELAEPTEQNLPPAGKGKANSAQAMATDSRVAALPKDGAKALKEAAAPAAGSAAAKFHGVTPGLTTRSQLLVEWGEPATISVAKGETNGGEVLGYELPPFQQVEALVEGDVVAVVRVTLVEKTSVQEMAERLRLTEIDPVEIADPMSDELLAVAFPEKGLTLLTQSAKDASSADAMRATVTQLVLEPIDARTFVLRSEQRGAHELKAKLADLQKAVEADPQCAQAFWAKAIQHLAAGQSDAAHAAAGAAVRLAPSDPAFRLAFAETLRDTAEYDNAVLETRKVLDDTAASPIVRAGALDLMGRLAAMGDKTIAGKTIDFHNTAITIADKLATSSDDRERRLAKDLLVSSHLSVAKEIARRDYNNKAETVAEWIGRASGIAEERIASDAGGLELRLQVAREALAALAQLRPTKDPGPWITEAKETAETLLAECTDPLMRARIHWELGEAYQHAVRIEHIRGDAQQALAYGSLSINELSEGAAPRTTSPAAEMMVGQLYFYLGAVNAVHKQDHTEAVGWYDKGRDVLTAERPKSEFVVPRRDGEELVSMGVSYWSQDQKDLAIELTESGARMMERAVAAGVLDSDNLAVPYGNLATMYKKVENGAKALEYGRLVQSVKSETPKPAPVAGAMPSGTAARQQKTPATTTTAQRRQPTQQQPVKQARVPGNTTTR
jgi:tetratricopeptide (TPR) repeat protein